MWWLLAQVQTPAVTIPSITVPTIIVGLIIAILIGAIAQLLVGYSHIGFLGHLLVGIIGAILGSVIAAWLHLPYILIVGGVDIVWTFIGSAILVAILALLWGGSRFRGFYRRRRYY